MPEGCPSGVISTATARRVTCRSRAGHDSVLDQSVDHKVGGGSLLDADLLAGEGLNGRDLAVSLDDHVLFGGGIGHREIDAALSLFVYRDAGGTDVGLARLDGADDGVEVDVLDLLSSVWRRRISERSRSRTGRYS